MASVTHTAPTTTELRATVTAMVGIGYPPWRDPDATEFPEWTEMARQFAPPFQKRPACTGPVTWKDWPAVERDIRNLRDAAAAAGARQVFMTSPSPGQIGRFLQNKFYPTD